MNPGRQAAIGRAMAGGLDEAEPQDNPAEDAGEGSAEEALPQLVAVLQEMIPALPQDKQQIAGQALELLKQCTETTPPGGPEDVSAVPEKGAGSPPNVSM